MNKNYIFITIFLITGLSLHAQLNWLSPEETETGKVYNLELQLSASDEKTVESIIFRYKINDLPGRNITYESRRGGLFRASLGVLNEPGVLKYYGKIILKSGQVGYTRTRTVTIREKQITDSQDQSMIFHNVPDTIRGQDIVYRVTSHNSTDSKKIILWYRNSKSGRFYDNELKRVSDREYRFTRSGMAMKTGQTIQYYYEIRDRITGDSLYHGKESPLSYRILPSRDDMYTLEKLQKMFLFDTIADPDRAPKTIYPSVRKRDNSVLNIAYWNWEFNLYYRQTGQSHFIRNKLRYINSNGHTKMRGRINIPPDAGDAEYEYYYEVEIPETGQIIPLYRNAPQTFKVNDPVTAMRKNFPVLHPGDMYILKQQKPGILENDTVITAGPKTNPYVIDKNLMSFSVKRHRVNEPWKDFKMTPLSEKREAFSGIIPAGTFLKPGHYDLRFNLTDFAGRSESQTTLYIMDYKDRGELTQENLESQLEFPQIGRYVKRGNKLKLRMPVLNKYGEDYHVDLMMAESAWAEDPDDYRGQVLNFTMEKKNRAYEVEIDTSLLKKGETYYYGFSFNLLSYKINESYLDKTRYFKVY